MKTKLHLIKGLTLGLLFMAPLLVSAQMQRPGDGGRWNRDGQHREMGQRHEHMMATIPDLSDQQKEDIKKIRLAAQKDIMPLRNKVKEKEAHLRTLNTAETVNTKEINSTIDEVFALKSQIAKRQTTARQDVRKLLTDEQRVAFDSHPGMGRMGRHGG